MRRQTFILVFGALVLAVLTAVWLPGCKGKAGATASSDEISLDTLAAVLGEAEGTNPGIAELSRPPDKLVINYHLYLPEQKDVDAQIGTDLAPKIQKLYRTFKSIDKVTFTIETGIVGDPASLQPYRSLAMTRKIYEEIDWTNLLVQDLFKTR